MAKQPTSRRSKQRVKLSDQIRAAVENCGQTRYAIWKATGIDQATLSRFIAGKLFISCDAMDKLADHLKLNISTEDK